MTSRHFEIFSAVADCGSMSQAARQLQITQPSVSQAVSDIEREYGLLLFERVNKRLYLTEAGRSFLPYAKRFLALAGEIDEFLRNAAGAKRIRIGATVTVGTCVISPLTAQLEKRIPTIRTEVTVGNTQTIETKLLNGELDIGLVEGRVSSPDLRTEHAIADTLVFICSGDHPFCGRKQISIQELAGQPLILREQGSGTRAQLEYQLRQRGIAPDVRWDCCNTEAILNAVGYGHGVSVLSRRLVENHTLSHRLWVAEFSDVDFHRFFDLVCYKGKLPGEEIQAFMEICRHFGTPPRENI